MKRVRWECNFLTDSRQKNMSGIACFLIVLVYSNPFLTKFQMNHAVNFPDVSMNSYPIL